MSSYSTGAENLKSSIGTSRRALVIGWGVPAAITAQALAETGISVTFARFRKVQDHPGLAMLPQEPSGGASFSPDLEKVEIVDVVQAPDVRRDQGVFLTLFEDGTQTAFDCLLLAPGLSLQPKPLALPQETELFTAQTEVSPGQHVVFLLDYGKLSHPALGMSAIQLAAENVRKGGASVVCFRHAPVLHVFGETLYDSARKAGVQFIRYGTILPRVRCPHLGEGPNRFRLVVQDVIDIRSEFTVDCDRIVVVTGPDASTIPDWARNLVNEDAHHQSFLLSDTIHSSSGASFASGVFVVGEATGNLDLMDCVTHARAAAARARAWMETSALRRKEESLTVSSACVRCLTCYRICPHHAVSLQPQTSRSRIEALAAFCRECGICVSVCPSGAMDLKASAEEDFSAFIGDVQTSVGGTKTVVFGCRRSAGLMAETIRMPEEVSFMAVPCAGRVSDHAIWSALAAGASQVLVVGCHKGNCASRFGTDLAHARVKRGRGLGILVGESHRIGYLSIAANEPTKFQRFLSDFVRGQSLCRK